MTDANNALTEKSNNLWQNSLGKTGILSAQLLLLLTLVGVVVLGLTKVSLVVIPLLIALILASAIAPVVRWFMRKGMPSVWATSISFLAILSVAGGVIFGIVLAIKSEWSNLVDSFHESYIHLWDFLRDGPLPIDDKMLADAQEIATDFLTSSSFSSGAMQGVGAASSFLVSVGILVVSLFYFLKDGPQMWSFILRFLPEHNKDKFNLSGEKVIAVLGGYVRGTAMIAASNAVLIWIALMILDVPLALPLAVLTFIGGFIPFVGATAANAFALLITLAFNGPLAALIVLIVIFVLAQLEANFLQPFLMGAALKIHGLVIILAITVGTILAGVVGAILSVPLAAAGWAVIKIFRGIDLPEDTKGEAAGKVKRVRGKRKAKPVNTKQTKAKPVEKAPADKAAENDGQLEPDHTPTASLSSFETCSRDDRKL